MQKYVLFFRVQCYEIDGVNLYTKIGEELLKNGLIPVFLSFNAYEYQLFKNRKFRVIRFEKWLLKNPDCVINISDETLHELTIFEKKLRPECSLQTNVALNKLAKAFLYFLQDLCEQYNFIFFVLWNGSFLYDRIGKYYSSEKYIRRFVLEQGYFRPFTLCMDAQGINSENSMPRDPEFYLNLGGRKLNSNLPQNAFVEKNILTLGVIRNFYYKSLKYFIFNKTKNVVNKFGKSKGTPIAEFYDKIVSKKNTENVAISGLVPYVFVPLQVETDSQVLLHSTNIRNMNELIKCVEECVEEYNSTYKKKLSILFKLHPKDLKIKRNEIKKFVSDNCHFVETHDINECIRNSELVITLNSTVGIEALCLHKPVITLGAAFYNVRGLTFYCDRPEKLAYYIDDALKTKVNSQLINNYINFLKNEYLQEIYWRNPDKGSIKRLVANMISEI